MNDREFMVTADEVVRVFWEARKSIPKGCELRIGHGPGASVIVLSRLDDDEYIFSCQNVNKEAYDLMLELTGQPIA